MRPPWTSPPLPLIPLPLKLSKFPLGKADKPTQARLARNSVTQGNYARPLVIAGFVKDVHAGFQLLNLKNDALRRRSDGVKYKVREVEDVVYDLSLRDLVPRAA